MKEKKEVGNRLEQVLHRGARKEKSTAKRRIHSDSSFYGRQNECREKKKSPFN